MQEIDSYRRNMGRASLRRDTSASPAGRRAASSRFWSQAGGRLDEGGLRGEAPDISRRGSSPFWSVCWSAWRSCRGARSSAPGSMPKRWSRCSGYCRSGSSPSGAFAALTHWAIRRQAFGRITRTQLSRSVGRVVTQVGLGLVTAGAFRPVGWSNHRAVGGHHDAGARLPSERGRAMRAIRLPVMARAAGRFGKFAMLSTGDALLNHSGQLACSSSACSRSDLSSSPDRSCSRWSSARFGPKQAGSRSSSRS